MSPAPHELAHSFKDTDWLLSAWDPSRLGDRREHEGLGCPWPLALSCLLPSCVGQPGELMGGLGNVSEVEAMTRGDRGLSDSGQRGLPTLQGSDWAVRDRPVLRAEPPSLSDSLPHFLIQLRQTQGQPGFLAFQDAHAHTRGCSSCVRRPTLPGSPAMLAEIPADGVSEFVIV